MAKYCPTCGNPLQFENAEICPKCGVRIQTIPSSSDIRNPFLAVVLSFFFVGWGQWYNGKTWDGLKLIGAFFGLYLLMIIFSILMPSAPVAAIFVLILFVLVLGIWVYGMHEAYTTADKINKGLDTFSDKSILFWLPVAFIGLVFLIIFAAVVAAFVFGMAGNVSSTKVIGVTAQQQGNDIIITYQGGMDAASVTEIICDTDSSQSVWNSPVIGKTITMKGATLGKDHIVCAAEFTDGSKQVVLDTYI